MSITHPQAGASAPVARTQGAALAPDWLVVLLALALAAVMAASQYASVWTTGGFVDPDDAMRLNQVRDLLAGQGWFDLAAHRLDPPQGVFMHWSRVVDLPLAAMIGALRLVVAPASAELVARLVFPFAMLALLMAGLARLARQIVGPQAVAPMALLAVLSGFSVGQFQPGRIDHHAPQIVLLVFMLTLTLAAIESRATSRGAARAAGAGALAALSLAISIENITFIVALAAVWPLLWLARGEAAAPTLRGFGLGFGAALALLFVATVAPARWRDASCDALSLAYAAPAVVGALACIALSFARAGSARLRLALFALAGGAVAMAFLGVGAACLRGPLSAVDPALRAYWLDNVGEARPLLTALWLTPRDEIVLAGPALLGVVLALWALWRSTGEQRLRWGVVAAALAAGLAASLWQTRALTSLAPLSLLGAVFAIDRLRLWLEGRGMETASLLALAAALPLSVTGWASAAALAPAGAAAPPAASCFHPRHYAPLARLPDGLVLAPIDAGAHVLSYTRHMVLAAPYHRNNHGNRLAMDAFLTSPQAAEAIVRASGADYVAICPGFPETALWRKRAPTGLGAQLADGAAPHWLEPLALAPGGGFVVWRVRPLVAR